MHDNTAFINGRFRGGNLFAATFRDCQLTGSRFEEARWTAAAIVRGDGSYTALRNGAWTGFDLTGAHLERTELRDANLERATLTGATWAGADLRGANLTGVALAQLDGRGVRIDVAQALLLASSLGAPLE